MRVLLIEDNIGLGEAIVRSLSKSGFTLDHFGAVEDGWHAWAGLEYDVVILDIMLGQASGLELLARARAAGLHMPVLLLTALGRIDQRVSGFEAGADDYLVKPFAMEELIARVRALGRRPAIAASGVIHCGNLIYDTAACEIRVGENRVLLSRGESIVLERLLRRSDRVVTKAELGESLHNLDQDYTDNSIQMHIHRVRRRLADLGAHVTIRALRGLGYIVAQQNSPSEASLK